MKLLLRFIWSVTIILLGVLLMSEGIDNINEDGFGETALGVFQVVLGLAIVAIYYDEIEKFLK